MASLDYRNTDAMLTSVLSGLSDVMHLVDSFCTNHPFAVIATAVVVAVTINAVLVLMAGPLRRLFGEVASISGFVGVTMTLFAGFGFLFSGGFWLLSLLAWMSAPLSGLGTIGPIDPPDMAVNSARTAITWAVMATLLNLAQMMTVTSPQQETE